jgi:hypothetical protein
MITLISMQGRDHAVPETAVYIGRANGSLQRSPLSNPFTVKDHGWASLGLYRLYLARSILEFDERVVGALVELAERVAPADGSTGSCTLACWCVERPAAPCALLGEAPARPCHGDMVASAVLQLGRELRAWSRGSAARAAWADRIQQTYGQQPLAPLLFTCFGARAVAELYAQHDDVRAGVPALWRAYCERWQGPDGGQASTRAPSSARSSPARSGRPAAPTK